MQREFFLTDSLNPSPYWDNVIVNLGGNQKFEQNTVFYPGRYRVEVQAGAPYASSNFSSPVVGLSGKIVKDIVVSQYFIVRGYCGSRATSTAGGKNPYSGAFKVNSATSNSSVPNVSHIFGNAGSYASRSGVHTIYGCHYSSGNCLGNGGFINAGGIGAGSCLHILPVGGTFGTNYLFAFHCVSGVFGSGGTNNIMGGVGSAYGGAGSGTAWAPPAAQQGPSTTYSGGSTPYGTGGAGTTVQLNNYSKGKNGTGIGYGYGGAISANGGGAWFNGTTWVDSRTTATKGADGYIKITYLGSIN